MEDTLARQDQEALEALARPAPEGCPGIERWLDGDRGATGRLAIHIARCPRCAAIAAALATAPTDVPPLSAARELALRRRARAIYRPEQRGVLRLTLRAIGRAIEVLDLVGESLTPVPVRSAAPGEDGVLVRHRFGRHEVTAHVSCPSDARFVIMLDVWGDPSRAAQGAVRLSLFRGERELASEIPRRGRALFPAIGAGHYRVVLSDEGGYVGELDLTLAREEAA